MRLHSLCTQKKMQFPEVQLSTAPTRARAEIWMGSLSAGGDHVLSQLLCSPGLILLPRCIFHG